MLIFIKSTTNHKSVVICNSIHLQNGNRKLAHTWSPIQKWTKLFSISIFKPNLFVAFTLFRLAANYYHKKMYLYQVNWICLLNWNEPMRKRERISIIITWEMKTKFHWPIKILPVPKNKLVQCFVNNNILGWKK